MARNIPSMKTLRDHFQRYVDHEYGDDADGKLRELREALEDWRDGKGMTRNEVLSLANEVLGGHGLEQLQSENERASATYVNMGDTYASTLLYDHAKGSFRATDWGTYVETEERRGNRFL
jgi:hypothetical protein